MANVKPVGRGEIGNAEEGEGRAEGLAAVAAKTLLSPPKRKRGFTPSFFFLHGADGERQARGKRGDREREGGVCRAEGLAAVAAKPCCLPKRNLNEPP